MSHLAAATAFALALDRDDFAAARSILHPNCVYLIRGKSLTGADAILASYQSATEDAHAKFDDVKYASNVSMQSENVALIEFSDILTHKGWTHHHKCHQQLTLDSAGAIIEIKHIDLPGERESLQTYLTKVGLE